ncbi:MAG: cyclic nucleotide-binding domain-containing protein [Deltaproteobacteria bacterium]|nr:cyclic nucleotide-binding domain-containing protein [Deltaproteobacteria bacterium]
MPLPESHVVRDPDPGFAGATIVARRDEGLGSVGLATCPEADADAEAACHLLLATVAGGLDAHREALDRFRSRPDDPLRRDLLRALEDAGQRALGEIRALGRRRGRTLEVEVDVLVSGADGLLVLHAGSGQVLLFRAEVLHRLARLPSVARSSGVPRKRSDPGSGVAHDGSVETFWVEARAGDRFVLLPPPVARALEDVDVRSLLAVLDPVEATHGLLALAREKGVRGALGGVVLHVPGPAARKEDSTRRLLPMLERMPLLAWCTQEERADLAARARPERVPGGTQLFEEGERGEDVYLLVSGLVRVLKGDAEVARLGSGSSFGEMALLEGARRTATVETVEASEMLILPRTAFLSLFEEQPRIVAKVLWNLLVQVADNLSRATEILAEASDRPEAPEVASRPGFSG